MPFMDPLFTLNDTKKRDPRIDGWFRTHPELLRGIARDWFSVMRACGGDVRETLHDGFPTACVGHTAFAHVATYSAHVNVAFFQGASLADPAGILEGSGRFMRHVKVKPGKALDEQALTDLIHSAYQDMLERLK